MINNESLLNKLSMSGLILTFISITIFLMYFNVSNYEISVYGSYPIYFWVFLILIELIGIQILIIELINNKKTNHSIIGILLIYFVNLLILLVPLKYYFYGMDDSISHAGYIKDILISGNSGISDFYPLSHIWVVIVSIISNLSYLKIILLAVPLFYSVYIIGIFLLSKKITTDENKRNFILIFSTIFPVGIYTSQFYPIGLGIFCIPLILYLFLKKDKIQYSFLFVLICFFAVFLHPLISVFLILALATYGASSFLYLKFNKIESGKFRFSYITNSILLLIVTLIAWMGSFWIFGAKIQSLVYWITGEAQNSYIQSYGQAVAKTHFSIFETIYLATKIYGPFFIYFALFIIAFIYIIHKLVKNKKVSKEQIFFLLLTIIFGVIAVFFLVTGFNLASNPVRIFAMLSITSSILSALVYYEIVALRPKRIKFLIIQLLSLILVFSMILGIFNIHPSPITNYPSSDVSKAEYTGGEWLVTKSNLTNKIFPVSSEFADRMRDGTLGFEMGSKGSVGHPPSHFGYENYSSINSSMNQSSLIAVTAYDKAYYGKIWTTQGSFNLNDFNKLKDDYNCNYIYTDGEFQVWYVK